mmetsp:Transcript_22650/g.57101  ORF Transcript_22650/g.57101 Transcript_22650/m.57101 type:complete len:94 (+) Transcript_22650:1-282(+)
MSAATVRQLLAELARKYLDDMILSMAPVLASPRTLAAGAILATMQAVSPSFSVEKLERPLRAADRWLDMPRLRRSLEEWNDLRRSQGKHAVLV